MDLEQEIRASLHRVATSIRVPKDVVERTSRQIPERPNRLSPWHSRVTAITVAVSLAVLALGLVWYAFRPATDRKLLRGATGEAAAIREGNLPGQPLAILATPQNVWVSTQDENTGEFSLLLLDSATGEVTEELSPPAVVTGLVWHDDEVWATTPDEVVRFRPDSEGVVSQFPVDGDTGYLASSGGYVWASVVDPQTETSSLVRLDPTSGDSASIVLQDAYMTAMAGTEEELWFLDAEVKDSTVGPASLVKLDPASGEVTAKYAIEATSLELVASGGYVWAASWLSSRQELGAGEDDRPVVVRVDAATGEISWREVPEGFRPIGVLGDGLWAMTRDSAGEASLVQVQTESLTIEKRIDLPEEPAWLSLDVQDERIWAISHNGHVYRIDLAQL